ncbi:VOC family protein [Methylobrevis albus]|uniref:Glyoxalase n=1 Tax=Methylobrevis albus TaxID=2793297 RepID=A0A931I4U8_9HYPH|nr:VOC family protein [Methylobrevis albus]MBH0238873.1 glyoxalase [Methylobrevis albus]
MIGIRSVIQVALAAGDLDATLAFWRDKLGLVIHARFEPPGIAFILAGDMRLFFAPATSPAAVYFTVPDLDVAVLRLTAAGVVLDVAPTVVFEDSEGILGPAGEAERMAFLSDPAGNTIGLVARRPIPGAATGEPSA